LQPTIYSSSDHHIKPSQIDKDALYVMAKLMQNGHIAYLVGGGVRDVLMGKTPKDFDVATSAKPEEVKRLFSNCLLIGRRFRLAHIRFGKKIIEVSTFRAGDTSDGELILRDNAFGSPEEDVLRRDFTINGLFYDPKNHSIIDFVGGVTDLEKHLLRTIGDPNLRFKQDPVRMIRLLKFQARFDFNICQEASSALINCREEILKSSPARVLEEFLRMLESGYSTPFLYLLQENGFLKLLMPGFEFSEKITPYLGALDQLIQQDRYHLPDRSLLIASLVYPLLKHDIESNDFGHIHATLDNVLQDMIASSFFPFPRRLRTLTGFILSSQFRLTPPGQKKPVRFRLARHPDFQLALQFLHLRSLVDNSLKDVYHLWKNKVHHKRERRAEKA
jgi:poly(A) polymerase